MDEYISREAIIKELKKEIKACDMKFVEDIWINKGLKIALKDIKSQPAADVQPVDQWISIEDRLPEVGKLVAVCDKQGDVGAMELLSNGQWYHRGMAWGAEWILYWQPLPEPPKDGET